MKKSDCCNFTVKRSLIGNRIGTVCSNCLKECGHQKSSFSFRRYRNLFTLLSIMLISTIPMRMSMSAVAKESKYQVARVLPQATLNRKSLEKYLKKSEKCFFYKIAMQQAINETGNLTSGLCISHNNLYSMGYHSSKKYHITRITMKQNCGVTMDFCKYDSWQDSVDDYLDWVERNCFSEADVYKVLAAKYATDSNYVNNLKKIKI